MVLAVSCSLMPREMFDVRKKIVTLLGLIRAAGDEPGDQSRVEKLSEGILQAISLPQFLDHAIECLRQSANFVSGANPWHASAVFSDI